MKGTVVAWVVPLELVAVKTSEQVPVACVAGMTKLNLPVVALKVTAWAVRPQPVTASDLTPAGLVMVSETVPPGTAEAEVNDTAPVTPVVVPQFWMAVTLASLTAALPPKTLSLSRVAFSEVAKVHTEPRAVGQSVIRVGNESVPPSTEPASASGVKPTGRPGRLKLGSKPLATSMPLARKPLATS